jgi:hypothetical protein
MSQIRDSFMTAAHCARALLDEPAVASAWTAPSALTGFTVGGLAAHLAAQVLFVPATLDRPPPAGDQVDLSGHYGRVAWLGADIDSDVNTGIRASGETAATAGIESLRDELDAVIAALPARLAAEPTDRLVSPPAGPWGLRLDDFLITRMMEIAVHSDDLACSVDRPTPDLPPDVLEPVFTLLTTLAVRRHGQAAVLRGLSRSERAPASISAL